MRYLAPLALCLAACSSDPATTPADAAADVVSELPVDAPAQDVAADVPVDAQIDASGDTTAPVDAQPADVQPDAPADAPLEAAADVPADAITCPMGRADCDGMAANGCEVNVQTDWEHCGSCARACPNGPPNASPACTLGACAITCAAGYGNCDGNPTNGCETLLDSDAHHCGACTTDCGLRGCTMGSCR